jgi:predicted ATP-grasp superfamily ATP-dependent carboligase
MHTVLIGLTTRALAESAAKVGQHVATLDYFGDRDQKAVVENYSLLRDYDLPFSAQNLLKASERLQFDNVIYTANLENHPAVVAALANRANLLGNGADVLAQIRDWAFLRGFCRQHYIHHPRTLLAGEERRAPQPSDWLCKPVAGGGGHGIRPWNGRFLKRSYFLQARVEGLPASAAFVANGEKAVVIGLSRQLIGNTELGGQGYGWCGNILPLPWDADQNRHLLESVQKMVMALTRHFGLKGIGGIDLVISEGDGQRLHPYLVEVNPRYTASMELMEWAYGINIYNLHINALDGHLPPSALAEHLNGPCFGKGIVFAYQSVRIHDTDRWRDHGWRDIPYPGDTVEPGHPICTVFSSGDTHDACLDNLIGNAALVRQAIGDMKRVSHEKTIYPDNRAHHRPGQRVA